MKVLAVITLMMCAGPALCAPEKSPRPVARGADGVTTAPMALQRPHLRPQSDQIVAMQSVTFATIALPNSLRPQARSPSLEQRVMGKRRKLEKGALCGETAIQGETVGLVPGLEEGCGIKDAVKVQSVSGIPLSQAAVIDCPTAQALRKWVDRGMTPALKPIGKVAQIKIAAHYACRTRNSQKGAKISEHGKGRAVDISGFVMQDGTEITVLDGWNDKKTSAALRKMHKAACGPFGTVLGPKADGFHRDHFHFDTARYRSGTFCR
jgi:hypothetical protein